jgi:hypothetical protein
LGNGVTEDWLTTGTCGKRQRDPLEQAIKLSWGDEGKKLHSLGRLHQKEKDSNSSTAPPWLILLAQVIRDDIQACAGTCHHIIAGTGSHKS